MLHVAVIRTLTAGAPISLLDQGIHMKTVLLSQVVHVRVLFRGLNISEVDFTADAFVTSYRLLILVKVVSTLHVFAFAYVWQI